ncbi:ribbon-helix-helix domain-containing protein [Acinetobacter brisouii]|uniref:ribbon-helix-helix domain-containing protein n=1 Tax=Acinetobacter brisouii TaxID=396323 RepID=UPI00124CF02B|nr:CopG family transcriptional regulator [Acinetobacter brisouii]
MSTKISPPNKQRSKKIAGGRVACILYLPPEEVKQIDRVVEQTGMSRSSVISNIYHLGKQSQNTNEG